MRKKQQVQKTNKILKKFTFETKSKLDIKKGLVTSDIYKDRTFQEVGFNDVCYLQFNANC